MNIQVIFECEKITVKPTDNTPDDNIFDLDSDQPECEIFGDCLEEEVDPRRSLIQDPRNAEKTVGVVPNLNDTDISEVRVNGEDTDDESEQNVKEKTERILF